MPDEDVNEVGVWGCEDGIEVGGASVDAEGTIHFPRRSTPRGHVAVGGEEVEGEEGGWDDSGVLFAEGVEVKSEVGEEEGGLLVDGVEDGLLAGWEEGDSLVCGGGEEDGLLGDSTENGPAALRGSDEDGVVVAVGAVVAGELSGAVLVDGGDEVPPRTGKKMAPSQSGKEMEE